MITHCNVTKFVGVVPCVSGTVQSCGVNVSCVRMHLALKAYHELLNCLCAMDQSNDAAVRNSAQVIKGTAAVYLADVDTGTSFICFHGDISVGNWSVYSVVVLLIFCECVIAISF